MYLYMYTFHICSRKAFLTYIFHPKPSPVSGRSYFPENVLYSSICLHLEVYTHIYFDFKYT